MERINGHSPCERAYPSALKGMIAMHVRGLVLSMVLVFIIIAPTFAPAEEPYQRELDCFIEPYEIANVGSEIPGIIEEFIVDRGDFVKKGQVVVKLTSGVAKATMESKKARLGFASREHKRISELYQKGIVSSNDMDQAEANLKIAKHEFQQANEILLQRSILSPVTGVVVERFLSPGERVHEEPILKVAQLNPLNVEVIAPVTMIGSVKVGDRAAVKPEHPIEREYIGRVKIVDRVIDAASGTFGIRIELKNNRYKLPAGLKCEVRFLGK